MFEFQSVLFAGDALLQAIADDQNETSGAKARISQRQHRSDPAVVKVQTALLDWDKDSLPVYGADGKYGSETARAVRRFKVEELYVPPAEAVSDVGPLTVQRLDGIRARVEQPPQPSTVLVRRDAWAIQSPEDPFDSITLAYAKAVQAMQARPATDPTSWAFQAAIHGSHARAPAGVRWGECQHQGWFFLPWHRMYLYFFERIVRAAVVADGGPAEFALPYWNYDQAAPAKTLPPAFREPTLPDNSPNPLFLPAPQRTPGIAAGSPVNSLATPGAAATALLEFSAPPGPGAPSFGGGRVGPASFGGSTGALESTPHNAIHRQVGGTVSGQCQGGLMIDPNCAALDPVFWLHHANVDRLWVEWLSRGGGRANPTDSAWLSERFAFHDETGAQVTLSVADVLDTASQLNYEYDVLPSVVVSPPSPTPPPPSPFQLVAATETPLDLAGTSASVPMTVPASEATLLGNAIQGAGRMTVSVEDIEAGQDPGVDYAVFLNLPDDADEAERQRHHIGNVTFFGIERMNDPDEPHDGAPGFRHTFDITDVAGALGDVNLSEAGSMNITFEPIALPGEEQVAVESIAPPGEERVAVESARPVRIGRVSLFVG